MCVCGRGRERVCVGEGESVTVCGETECVCWRECVWEWERPSVCVGDRVFAGERVCVGERECVCGRESVCAGERVCV